MSKFNPEIKENIESIDIKLGNGHHGYVLDEKLGDSKLVSETKDNEENDIISSASCIVIIKLKNEEEPLEYIYERAGSTTDAEGGYLIIPKEMSMEELSKWLKYAPSVSPSTYDIIAAAKTLEYAEPGARQKNDYSQIAMNAPWRILLRGIKGELINSATKAVYDRENEMLIIGEVKEEEQFHYDFDTMAKNIIDETTNCSINTEEIKVTDEEQLRIEAARQAAEETNNAGNSNNDKRRTGFVYGLRSNGKKQAKNRYLGNNPTEKPYTKIPFNGR